MYEAKKKRLTNHLMISENIKKEKENNNKILQEKEKKNSTENIENKISNIESKEINKIECKEISGEKDNLSEQNNGTANLPLEKKDAILEKIDIINDASIANVINYKFDDDIFGAKVDDSMQVWGKVLLKIKNSDDKLLYAIINDVSKTHIEKDEFIIYTDIFDSYKMLNELEIKNKISKILSMFCEKKLVVKFYEEKDNESNDIKFLKEKFGEYLVIKK